MVVQMYERKFRLTYLHCAGRGFGVWAYLALYLTFVRENNKVRFILV